MSIEVCPNCKGRKGVGVHHERGDSFRRVAGVWRLAFQ